MATPADFRQRARATWSSGDWDAHSRLLEPVGALVLERIDLRPGIDLLDVGTGTGGNVAIPAALRGAKVVGLDVAPELFEHARRRATEAGVDVEWVEGDAQELPFAEESFDRVVSTFGAMFAPDHERAAGELVRVCRPGGLVAMTTWANDGFAAGLFKLNGTFLPPPPAGVQPPPLWGIEDHVEEVFAAAGATPEIAHETLNVQFPSEAAAVEEYTTTFGPIVTVRTILEPQGRWPEFVEALADLVHRSNVATDGTVRIPSKYFLITLQR